MDDQEKLTIAYRDQRDRAIGQLAQSGIETARLRARVAELEAAQAWRPIETAPRNGTNFLAASSASSVFLAHWANGVVDSSSFDEVSGYHERHATSWLPLPAPPKTEGAE